MKPHSAKSFLHHSAVLRLAVMLLSLVCVQPTWAQSAFERLRSFGSPSTGGHPEASMTEGQDGHLYGTAPLGGQYNKGVIYRTSKAGGDYAVLVHLNETTGHGPAAALVVGPDGALYGSTVQGGTNNNGTLFRVEPVTQSLTVLKNLDSSSGSHVQSAMIVGTDNKLYGMARYSGDWGAGTIFRLDADGANFEVLLSFENSPMGGHPEGGLKQASDGLLYGFGTYGGTNEKGTMFRVATDGSNYTVMHHFEHNATDGGHPGSTVVEGTDGALYGTTFVGGSNDKGTIFKINKNGTGYTVLHHLNDAIGCNPRSALILEPVSGSILGVNEGGGSGYVGTLFQLDPDGSNYTILHHFGGDSGGGNPQGIMVSNLIIYGTNSHYGSGEGGTLFKDPVLTGNGSYEVLYSFLTGADVSNGGGYPVGGLLEGPDGKYYGMTDRGGTNGGGTLFRVDADGGNFTVLVNFTAATTGRTPRSKLLLGADGKLYGTTASGGNNGLGTVFKVNTDGTGFTVLLHCEYSSPGQPYGNIIQANDGKLYGTTTYGGGGFQGSLFRLDTDGSNYSMLKEFDGGMDGGSTLGGVVQAPDGKLYGTTAWGGSSSGGVLYRINTDGSGFAVLKDFTSSTGSNPAAAPVVGNDGRLYGCLQSGGSSFGGALYSVNTDGSGYTTLHHFSYLTGTTPLASLTKGTGGILYGTASGSGGQDGGVVFKLDPDGSNYTVVQELSYYTGTGRNLQASVTEGSDGNLYSVAYEGGELNAGTMFRVLPAASGAPEIAVEQPAGTDIADGGSQDFGSVNTSGNASLTFTIKNLGDADLTGLDISIDGVNAGEFTVTMDPAAPVSGPSGSTTFTVEFAPGALGPRMATLHIASNDADENPFDITLTGFGGTSATALNFDGSNDYAVSAGTVSVFGSTPTTIEFWARRATGNTGRAPIGIGDNKFYINLLTNGFSPWMENFWQYNTGVAVTNDSWNHYAVTYDGVGTFRAYVNGVPTPNPTFARVQATLTGNVYIGDRGPDSSSFKGDVDELRIWSVQRSDAEILANYDQELASVPANLLVYYRFNQGFVNQDNTAFGPAINDAVGARFATMTNMALSGSTSNWVAGVLGTAQPGILIEAPAGTYLSDGTSTSNLGSFLPGESAPPRTYTVTNNGQTNLTGLTVGVTGTNAADFVLGALGATTLAPGESTTFDITFTPGALGTRTALATVTNNVFGGNAIFEIQLTGMGAPPEYTVTTTGNAIVVTDVAGNGETLTISEPSAGTIEFAAADRTFRIDDAASVVGASGNLSLSGITSITVNAGNGGDTVTLFGFTSLPSLTINGDAGADTVNLRGGITFAANANLAVTAETLNTDPAVAITTSGAGTIAITADNVAINATSTLVSASTVSFAQQTTARTILIGTENSGSLSLTDAELDRITSGATVIGSTTNGEMTFSAAITHPNSLTLLSGSSRIVQNANATLTLASGKNLIVTTMGGQISMNQAITVSGTASFTAGAGEINANNAANSFTGLLSLSNSGPSHQIVRNSAATGTTLGAIVLGSGNFTIISTGGISQTSPIITGPNAALTAGGPVTLTDVNNDFSGLTLTHSGSDNVSVVDRNGMTFAGTLGSGNSTVTCLTGSLGVFGVTCSGNATFTAPDSVARSGAFNRSVAGTGTVTYRTNGSITGNANITATTGSLNVVLNADRDANGSGNVNLGGTITTNGGSLTAGGGTDPALDAATGTIAGIDVSTTTITTAGGAISLRGQGSSTTGFGIRFNSGASFNSGGGSITIHGTGGGTGNFQNGIKMEGAGITIAAAGGNVSITGVHPSSAGFGYGMEINEDVSITTTGGGSVTLTGSGGSNGYGVYLRGSTISVADGLLSITGTGASTSSNVGIYLPTPSATQRLLATGSGAITLTGISGGAATFSGIDVATSPTYVPEIGGGSGPITFISDVISLNAGVISTTGSAAFRPHTNGRGIRLGSDNAAELSLADSELDLVTAASVIIGDSNSGAITIAGHLSPAGYKLLSLTKDVTWSSGTFASDIGATSAIYEGITASGTVILTGATLSTAATGGFTPTIGNTFTILNNDGSDAIAGTFTGLPEGEVISNFLGSSLLAAISYEGGDGNDVVLTVLSAVEMEVEQPAGTAVADGGSRAFGEVLVAGSGSMTFTISNTGSGDLTGVAVTIDGMHAGEFIVTDPPDTTVAGGASTTFTIEFSPAAVGARTAALHISSNDADENPYDVVLSGTGVTPEIAVEQPAGTNIADGGTKDFGSVTLGSNGSLTFTVNNTGDADLTGLTINKDGAHAADFTITASPVAPVAGPSGSTTFTVQFAPSAAGMRTAALHIASNDSDENPFDINLTGMGTVTSAWTVTQWTGDSTSNVVSGETLWGYNFGTSSSATINGVTFTGVSSTSYSDADITVSASSIFNNDPNNLSALGGGGSGTLARDFFYGWNSGFPVVKNLSIGQTYTVSFFGVGFDSAQGVRVVDFNSGGNTIRVDESRFGDNNGVRLDFTFTATSTTQSFSMIPENAGYTWHLYGLALRTASSPTLASNAASWWRAEGNANDSISTNHGTLQNGATFADGLVKQAFSFDGVNDFVTVPSSANLNFGTANDFTVEMWVKLNGSQPSFNGILSKAGTSYPWAGYQLAIYQNRFAAEIGIGSYVFGPSEGLIGSTLLNDGYWHHLAMVVSRSTANVKLFVDGRQEVNLTHGAVFSGNGNMDNSNPLYIGVERGAGIFFKGWIDEPAIYRSALTAAQIQGIHAASSLGKVSPEIAVTGNSANIADGSGSPAAANHTDFELAPVAAGTVVRTYTVTNSGIGTLTLGAVSLSGTHAADFAVTSQPAATVAEGQSTSFQVTFDPSASGTRSAILSFATNDADENPFNFSIQGTGQSAPAVTTPSVANLTTQGATLGGNVTNDGSSAITERGIVYSPTAANSDPLIDGANVTKVTITGTTGVFTTDVTGLNSGTEYSFKAYAINAFGIIYTSVATFTTLTPAEIAVTGNGEDIADGDNSPSEDDHTDFGSVAAASGTVVRTFTISNSGTEALNVGTVSVSGANAADFTVSSQPPASVAGLGFATFQVTFNPSAFGLRSATLSFSNNDSDENPFNFSIQGTGENSAPTISDIANTTINEDGTTGAITFTIGDADVGTTFSLSATSDNTGLVPNGNISLGGSGANRTVTVTPVANLIGSVLIMLEVSDGTATASDTFTLTVNEVNDAPSFTLSSTALSVLSAPAGSNGYSIGTSSYGQLAAGTGVISSTTVRSIVNVSDFVQISAGDYGGCGLREDGTVWVWGRNEFGQLANGVVSDASPSFVPLQVPGLTDVTKVEAGFGWFLALKSDGTVWGWGRNAEGCLGQGTTGGTSTVPVQIQGLSNVTDISAGAATAMALTSAGTVYTWGGNQNGNLGRGTVGVHSGTATAIAGLTGNVARIFETKGWTYFVQKTNGEIWAWGVGVDGTFGDGRSGLGVLSVVNPFRVTNLEALPIASLRAGYNIVLALLTDGTVKGWGNNGNGQLGIGSATGTQATPVTLPSLSNIVQIETDRADGYALGADGRVWAWGNQNGTPQKGISPALVTGFSNIASITAGSEFLLARGSPPAPVVGLTVTEDSAAGNIPLLVDSFSPGPVSEAAQTVDFLVTNDNNALFSVQPAISEEGTLTYGLAANANGSSIVTVRAHDDGGTTNSGVDTSAAQTFTIIVTPENDAPVDLTLSSSAIAENNAANATVGAFSTTDADAGDNFTYALVAGDGDTDNDSFTISGDILRLTPSADYESQNAYAIRVSATDVGGLSFEKEFTITITDVNESPVLTTPTAENITAFSADLGGDVISDSGSSITERGVVYAPTAVNSDPQIGGTGVIKLTGSGTTGVFSLATGLLTPNTSYSFRAYAINDLGAGYTEPVSIFTTLPVSDIAVEQPAGTGLAHGGSRNFGLVSVLASAELQFTIKNLGTADLTDLDVGVAGADAGMFAITENPSQPVEGPAGVTTFTVEFTPTSRGVKSALLTIESNDPDESPYEINLTGTGGEAGAALALDGVDDAIEIAAHADFNTPTFTVEGWVKPGADTAPWARLWGTENNKGDLIVRTGNENRFSFAPVIDGEFHQVYAPSGWEAGQWYHVAGVVDHNKVRLFVNGEEVASRDKSSAWQGDSGNRYIGKATAPVAPNRLNGVIDEVRYWNYARNCDQIEQSFEGELTGGEAGLVAYYNFNQGVADADNPAETTAADVTGHGHAGTLESFALADGDSSSNWTTPGAVASGVFAPTPQFAEIALAGNGADIWSGDTTPTVADYTDFGPTNSPVTRTFTIRNDGNIDLNVTSVTLAGASAASFTLDGITTPAVIPGGGNATFTISVSATETDVRSATVLVSSSDCDEGSYDFAIYSAPPIEVTTTGGAIVVADPTSADGTLAVVEAGAGMIRFENERRSFTVDGVSAGFGSSGDLSLAGISSIAVNGSAGADTVNVGAFVTALPNLAIDGKTGADSINFNGDLGLASNATLSVGPADAAAADTVHFAADSNVALSGSGSATIAASGRVSLDSGASLASVDGDIAITGGAAPAVISLPATGVTLAGATIETTGQGSVSVTGFGGSTGSGSAGITLTSSSLIRTLGAGTLTLIGSGGSGVANLDGVVVDNSTVSSASGTLTVIGTGGQGSGLNSRGVSVQNGGLISGLTVNVTGSGGLNGGGGRRGVHVTGANSTIRGDVVSVSGSGGLGGSGTANRGISVAGGGAIQTIASASTGSLILWGTEGDGASAVEGIALEANGLVALGASPSASSAIVLQANSIAIDTTSALVDATARSVTIHPRVSGHAIALGAADSLTQLGLADAELDRISAATLTIGHATIAGPITQFAPITRPTLTNLHLVGSAAMSINVAPLYSAGGDITISSGAAFTASAIGTDVNTGGGALAFANGNALGFAINGAVPNTGYQQLAIEGSIALTGLELSLNGTHVPLKGQTFILINNDGTDPVVGMFNGLGEGETILLNSVPLTLSYVGGTGNDVTLAYAAPTLTQTRSAIIVNEGSTATNSGTVTDLQGGVTLSASHGIAVDNGDGTWSWTYTPDDGPADSATVIITATDNSTPPLSATASFALTVNNVAPTAAAVAASTNENEAVTIDLLGSDPGSDSLTYEIVTPPQAAKGSLGTLSGNQVTFTPAMDFFGPVTFTYKVTDSDSAVSKTATVTVNIAGINAAPAFVKGASRTHAAGFTTTQSVPGWATGISDGDPFVTQLLTFEVTQIDGEDIFATDPAITGTGTLTYRTNGEAGTATLSVVLRDNGGTDNGGVHASPAQTFTIFVSDDSTKPTVAITAPAVNANVAETNDGSVVVSGTAADNKQVQKVQVKMGTGNYADATLTPAPDGKSATFTTLVTPAAGLNTIRVRSQDANGNLSTEVVRSFTYVVLRPLTVAVTPANSGTVAFSPALVSGKAQIGKSYTVTATAKSGFFFDEWDGEGTTGATLNSNKITFAMTEDISATPGAITAKFIESPFRAGTYTGLATPSGGTTPSQTNLGKFTGTLTSAGSMTISLNFGGVIKSIVAKFDPKTGNTSGTASGFGYTLHLDLTDDTDKVTGSLTQTATADITSVDADRAAFSSTSRVPDQFLKDGNNTQNGVYNIALPAIPDQDGYSNEQYPQGDGFGTLTVTPTGTVTMTATLPEGTVVTSSAPLSKAYQWPLAALVRSTSTVTGLTLGGMVQFDTSNDDSDVTAASLKWFRPAKSGVTYYPAGWPAGISTFLTGAKFNRVTGNSVLPGLAAPNAAGNAVLQISDGLLTTNIAKDLNISTANAVTKIPNPDSSYTLTITGTTGGVGGSFKHTGHATLRPVIKGLILQKGANRGGYGFFLSPGASAAAPGQSGGITLTPK